MVFLGILAAGCQGSQLPPLATAPYVALERFMGDWYVIATLPTPFERGAHNAVETYRLASDGTIDTTFKFRADGFEGKAKTYKSRGFVVNKATNAHWGVQFIWPIKADYRIIYVASDYSQTVIGREKRDYAWIMARTPTISTADFARLKDILASQGYDTARLIKVPQQWGAGS
jgi:apolipoprotein D and lipocalin family protein